MPESKGIPATAIAIIFAGGIFLWSGLKGWKLTLVTQDLISGKNPQSDPRVSQSALTVSPGGLFGGIIGNLLSSTSNTGGSANLSLQSGSAGRFGSAFARSLLATINAPQTAANIASIEAWARREGGGGANNPLNTTLGMPGATDFNSVGVKNYASMSVGIIATARTLLGGNYADVVAALKSGNGLCGRSFSGLSTWSGGGYSSVC